MKLDHPTAQEIPGLRVLWKTAFGDTNDFLDQFFSTAYSPERCLCATEDDQVCAALYWLNASCRERKFAYIYAVATDPARRGRGLCRRLMDAARKRLQQQGYAGALLVPVSESLIQMYSRMGYSPCTTVSEFRCFAALPAAPIQKLDAAAYARSRRQLLPEGSVLQEGESLAFLETQASFYAGPGFLAVTAMDGEDFHCLELLGDTSAAPQLLSALDAKQGFFRCPGGDKPFAMFQPLTDDCPKPSYFGFAFD